MYILKASDGTLRLLAADQVWHSRRWGIDEMPACVVVLAQEMVLGS